MPAIHNLRVRPATDDDRERVARIAYLDSSRPFDGPALIGEIDGIAVAVLSLTTGKVVANPFRHTADLVEVMRARAAIMGGVSLRPSLGRRLGAAVRGRRALAARF
jgi:hypothetical protein